MSWSCEEIKMELQEVFEAAEDRLFDMELFIRYFDFSDLGFNAESQI